MSDSKEDKEAGAATAAWAFSVFVAGDTPASAAARANLEAVCEEYLPGRYAIDVVDLLVEPSRAEADQIFAIPTVLRRSPGPPRKVIGDLSDKGKVLDGFQIPRPAP